MFTVCNPLPGAIFSTIRSDASTSDDDKPDFAAEIGLMTRQVQTETLQQVEQPLVRLLMPRHHDVPLLVSSPHSGRIYPPAFVAGSRLDPHMLRRSEDCFVDELFAEAPALGIPLLAADFPRAYCDVNREPWELDQTMFSDRLPAWCTTRTARIEAGFGTIARLVSTGHPIYAGKLPFAEAEDRIRTCWHPFHDKLAALIAATVDRHGGCILLDCHSMPVDTTRPRTGKRPEVDFILGDAHGTSCAAEIVQAAQQALEHAGFAVRRNDPYSGGYVTRHYGRPNRGIHVLQLEISRGLYLDQAVYERLPAFDDIRVLMTSLLQALVDAAATVL